GNTADPKYLARSAWFIVLGEKRYRSARFCQTVWVQVALVVGDELLNLRRRYLRDQIADFLIVSPGMQWLHDVPMVATLLQFHLAGRRFQECAHYLRHDQVGELAVSKIFRLFVERFLD